MNVTVIYDSYYGSTKAMAAEVAAGASSVAGAAVRCLSVDEASRDDLEWADGIALGCPTHMGSIAWQMKRFIDEEFAALWQSHVLVGKAGTVFTTGGAGGAGGTELTQIALLSNLAQHGMILVTHPHNMPGFRPDGMAWGATWATGRGDRPPTQRQIDSARSQGQRLAEVAGKLMA